MAMLTLKPFCKNKFSLSPSLSPQELTEIKCEILLVNRSVHHYSAPIKVPQMEGSGLAALLVLDERSERIDL